MATAAVTPMGAGTLNVALSNFAKGYRNNAMVGEILAPRLPVDRESFQYVVFDRSNQRLDQQTLRAPGARPQVIRWSYSTSPYVCASHALSGNIPRETEQYTMGLGFSSKKQTSQYLMDKILLDREVSTAAAVNIANYPNLTTLSGTSMWDSYLTGGTSHPIQVMESAKSLVRQAGVDANFLILSDPVVQALQNHPDVVERFKYTTPGAVTLDDLTTVFGVKCYRASAVLLDKNNVASWVWNESAILGYSQAVSSMQDISAMKTFVWSNAPDTTEGYGVLEFPDPFMDSKSDWVSTDMYYDIKPTAPETLVPFLGCVTVPTMGAIPAPVEG